MIRAVFDTNVFVSALLSPRGVAAELLKKATAGTFELVVSQQIIEELEKVLCYPRIRDRYGLDQDTIDLFLGFILETSLNVGTVPELCVVPGDPADNPIVSTAIAANAEFLVSGDQEHILALPKIPGVMLISPREFLDRFHSET